MPNIFTIVSYNVRGQYNLYKDLIDFVNITPYAIVAVQERPNIVQMNKITEELPDGVKHIYRSTTNDLAVIYPSSLLITEMKLDACFENFMRNDLKNRTLFFEIELPDENITFVNVHGFSKQHESSLDLNKRLFELIGLVKKSPRHMIIGDFNMNPYEEACLYNETTCFSYREKEFVKNNGGSKPIYYNPSWKYLSEKKQPKGTLYYEGCSVQWAMLDQVLISKDFVDSFCSFEIPLTLGTKVFLNSRCQKKEGFSDHMPIKITMEF